MQGVEKVCKYISADSDYIFAISIFFLLFLFKMDFFYKIDKIFKLESLLSHKSGWPSGLRRQTPRAGLLPKK